MSFKDKTEEQKMNSVYWRAIGSCQASLFTIENSSHHGIDMSGYKEFVLDQIDYLAEKIGWDPRLLRGEREEEDKNEQ
jgi:hypothetical protein